MVSVIEADADERAGAAGGIDDGVELGRAARARLFDKHVLARGGGVAGDRRQHVVGGGDEDDVDIGALYSGLPIGGGDGAGSGAGEGFGALEDGVAADGEGASGERFSALLADQAASDDGSLHGYRCPALRSFRNRQSWRKDSRMADAP